MRLKMKTFKDYINEAMPDLNDFYGVANDLSKFLKQSGYQVFFKCSPSADKGKKTSPIYIHNGRTAIKDRYCDVNETRYEYQITGEFKNDRLEIKITKRWYDKTRLKTEETVKKYDNEKLCFSFLTGWFKEEVRLGCFDKGKFTRVI